jgi:DNA-binding response OmpR family regulator
MPAMDGIEFARRIRQSPDLNRTIIIATSANTSEEDQHRSRLAGCDAFIPKPVQAEHLRETLQQFIDLPQISPNATEPAAPGRRAKDSYGPLPAAELTAMRELAIVGDIRALRQRIATLEQQDERFKPLVDEIKHLMQSFQLEAIIKLLQSLAKQSDR